MQDILQFLLKILRHVWRILSVKKPKEFDIDRSNKWDARNVMVTLNINDTKFCTDRK